MSNIIEFIEAHLDLLLLSLIILSGIFITKYVSNNKISDVYKVLIASVFISIILYFVDGCTSECLKRYIFTYLFATSFYELIVKFFIEKINNFFKSKTDNQKKGFHVGDRPDDR